MLLALILFVSIGMVAFGFEFPSTVEKVEDVPEKFRPLYTKGQDGKFVLDEEVKAKTDNTGLTSALDKERKAKKELEKAIASWKKLEIGETPEEAMELIKQYSEEKEEEGDEEGANQAKKLMAKLQAEADARIKGIESEATTKLDAMKKTLNKHMIESEARAVIAELKGSADLLLPHVREQCQLLEEDGVFVVRVVDKEGDPRSDGKGGWMDIKALVAEMKASQAYGRAFESSGKSGSGTLPGSGNKGGGGSDTKLTSVQKIAKGLAERQSTR